MCISLTFRRARCENSLTKLNTVRSAEVSKQMEITVIIDLIL